MPKYAVKIGEVFHAETSEIEEFNTVSALEELHDKRRRDNIRDVLALVFVGVIFAALVASAIIGLYNHRSYMELNVVWTVTGPMLTWVLSPYFRNGHDRKKQ